MTLRTISATVTIGAVRDGTVSRIGITQASITHRTDPRLPRLWYGPEMKQIQLEQGVVGRSPPRKDGADKVTGRARYLDDLSFEGQLWGRTVRSHVPHGRIKSITWDPDFDWSDVVRVTAADIPGENIVHLIEDDQPMLAADLVRHREEPIALVASADREKLEEALL